MGLDSAIKWPQTSGGLAGLKAIAIDREGFDEAGVRPTSVSTRTRKRRMAIARRKLESARASAVRDYTRNGNLESAQLIQDEFDRFKQTGSLKNTAIGLLDRSDLNPWRLRFKASKHWALRNGVLRFDGVGGEDVSIGTKRSFKNFTLRCDLSIGPGGDSGIYIRGKPQSALLPVSDGIARW